MRFLRLGRWAPIAMTFSVAISMASRAHAFTDAKFFHEEALEGGTEGRWFTGSPADGFGCSVCHSGRPAERVVVEGFPTEGYVPGKVYQIRISWPDVALRQHAAWRTAPPTMLPRASLVAEVLSETGRDSGNIKQGTLKAAQMTELCAPRSATDRKQMGHQIFRQTVDRGTRVVNDCFGQNFTRCLVSVKLCGAEEVRFTWEAPLENQGALWFSLGFVASDVMNSKPDQDAVTEITIPIAPASSSGYESQLGQACAVTVPGGGRSVPWIAIPGLAVFGLGVRRRARSRRGEGGS